MRHWYLEGFLEDTRKLSRFPLARFPCRLGRSSQATVTIPSPNLSRLHAELDLSGDDLVIHDLSSTNGTFVNRQRIDGPRVLQQGDIVHLADIELRVMCVLLDPDDSDATLSHGSALSLPDTLPVGAPQLLELISTRQVTCAFHALIGSHDRRVFGYELLGRGCCENLPASPGPLFRIAESVDLEVELSELFREQGMELAGGQALATPCFVNTHPRELEDEGRLMRSVENLRNRFADIPLVLEIHEQAITDSASIKRLSEQLAALQIDVAYDDFGAGQARLVELADSPPAYLKFDIGLIRGIHLAPATRQDLVAMLVDVCHKMGSRAVAEGVESGGEAEICGSMGFDLLQGFFFGKPASGPLSRESGSEPS